MVNIITKSKEPTPPRPVSNGMQAVILAAGVGTRLRPLTNTTPKPMLKVGGKPILEHLLSSLPEEITEVIVVVEYLREQIENYFGLSFFGKKITYATQGEMKGTYGALYSAKKYLRPGKFLVIGGDDLHTKENLEKLTVPERALGYSKITPPSKNFFSIEKDAGGKFTGMRRPQENENLINVATGAYVLDENIWKYEPVSAGGNELGLPQTILLMNKDFPFTAIEQTGWFQINTPADLQKANEIKPN